MKDLFVVITTDETIREVRSGSEQSSRTKFVSLASCFECCGSKLRSGIVKRDLRWLSCAVKTDTLYCENPLIIFVFVNATHLITNY